jgi:asparagine synthase (glutamine-hydrolysing)
VRKLAPATVRVLEPDRPPRDRVYWQASYQRRPEHAGWDGPQWREAVGEALRTAAHRRAAGELRTRCAADDYFERALETAIADDGVRIRPLDISAFAAVEVDFEDDLTRANLRCLPLPDDPHPALGHPPLSAAAPSQSAEGVR